MKILLHGFYDRDFTVDGFVDLFGQSNVDFFAPLGDWVDPSKGYKLEEIDSYDLIVFERGCFFDPNFEKILRHQTSSPKIYVDTSDDLFIKRICKHKEIKHYFKREMLWEIPTKEAISWSIRHAWGTYGLTPILHWNKVERADAFLSPLRLPYKIASIKSGPIKKVTPYPLTITPSNAKMRPKKRDIDLSFTLRPQGLSERKEFSKYLAKFKAARPESKILINYRMKQSEYTDAMLRSKASVSLRGYGYDTRRYWEIASLGAVIMSEKLPLVIPNNFVDCESALFFSSKEQFEGKFRHYVANSDEWREIGKAAQKLFYKYHTPEKRVQDQILDEIGM